MAYNTVFRNVWSYQSLLLEVMAKKRTSGICDYGGHCLALAQTIRRITPNAVINCKRGRQGSFEVVVNDRLIYSKLQTMALPDYDEVSQVVNDVSQGGEPRQIIGQQPINCVIS